MCSGGIPVLSDIINVITGSGGPPQPLVVRSNPVADQAAIDTQAAQEAQAAKLAKQQRAKANSLLSSYGGAGDLTQPDTTTGKAKPTLGA